MICEYVFFLFRGLIEIIIARLLKTDLERRYLLALKENQILRRKWGKHPPALYAIDRNFYVALKRASKNLLSEIVLIRPETVLAWHRKLVAYVDGLDSARVGRPRVTDEIRHLVLRMKLANPRWGCKRIAGEIGKLGLKTCSSSVRRILREEGYDVDRARKLGISWKAFMKSNGDRIWACDFFSVSTVFLKKLHVFFMIDVHTKAIEMVEVVPEPTAEWLKNRLRLLFAFAIEVPGIVIADRGTIYRSWMMELLEKQYGIEFRQTPPHVPQFNCYAERMVRTFREELTDRVFVYGERDLRAMIREYVEYYNERRVHSSISFKPPRGLKAVAACHRELPQFVERSVLSGLITDFERVA